MVNNLYGTIGESNVDNLVADISFPLQTGSAILKADQGLLLRGTLLGKEVGGEFVKATATVDANCILADDIMVDASPVTVVTYISGAFSKNALIAENDVTEHQEKLRTEGIYIKATVGGE